MEKKKPEKKAVEAEKKHIKNICCFGGDPIGVATSCVMASMCPSLKIAIVDIKPEKIAAWNSKQIPSQEPALDDLLKKCQNKNLVLTADIETAVKSADTIFLTMNTTSFNTDKAADLSDFEKAARIIAETASFNKIIVEKSTVPVGSHKLLKKILQANKQEGAKFDILSNPEFFSEGSAIENLLHPDRVLIGSDKTKGGMAAAEALASVYAQWVPRTKIVTMSTWSAELAKLSVNAFLAQRISSVNAISMICEATSSDIAEIVRIIGSYSPIGPKYLNPSLGFGGNHLPKDIMCLIYMCEYLDLPEVADYWREVLKMNEFQKNRFKKKVLYCFFNTMTFKKVGIWGVAYKKGSDITGNSPGMYICKCLLEEGAKINIYDPKVEKRQILEDLKDVECPKELEKCITICDDPYKAAQKTHAVVCCTDCDEFKTLDYGLVYKDMMRPAYIFDGHNCLPHEQLIDIGFIVKTLGRQYKEA